MKRTDITTLYRNAKQDGFALGSFSPRNTALIPYVVRAAVNQQSPVIIQISSNELRWFELDAKVFADAFYDAVQGVDIPVILHLDHTYDVDVIKKAIEAGFQSVMIDGSQLPFDENVRITKEVVAYAHDHDVAVEAELGSIGGADKLETGCDASLFTVPEQAAEFVKLTGCDSLAVSVGSAHGVYPVKNPHLDYDRIAQIMALTDIPLVLHGGSGLPQQSVERAIRMDGKGGIIKLNIATDLELIFQQVMGVGRMPNAETLQLDPAKLKDAGAAVQAFCEDRMQTFLFSSGKAQKEFAFK